MKIQFLNISIEGFLSIGSPSVVDLTRDGITLVKGRNRNPSDNAKSNGSGKSSIFEAIYFALTGYTIRGIKGKDVVNRNYSLGCCVELNLIRGTDEFRIIRSRSHQIHGTSVQLFMNGDDVSGKSMKGSSDLITEYLPELSYNIIGSILILGQGLPHKLTAYSPSGRKQLLEELSGTGAVLSELTNRIYNRKVELTSTLDGIDKKINAASASIVSYQKIIVDTEDAIKSYNAEGVTKELAQIEENRTIMDSSLADLDAASKSYDEGLRTLQSQMSDIRRMISESDGVLNSYSRNINKLGSGVCPTCNRPFENANELIREKEELTKKIAEITAVKAEYKLAYDKVEAEYNGIYTLKSEFEKEIRNLNSTLSELDARKLVLTNMMEVINNSSKTLEKYVKLSDDASKEIEALRADKTNYESKLECIKYLDRITSKEFKTYMLGSVIEYLNSRACHYASKFFTDGRMKIYASGNSIEIEVGNKPYEALSGGEAQKANLAIQFAMRDMLVSVTGLHCNLLVLDEVFDNLDEVGCSSLLDILSTDLGNIESMYVITHHSDIEVPYDHEIEVVKDQRELTEITQVTR